MSPIFTTFVQSYNETKGMSSPLTQSIRQPLYNFWGIALLLLFIMLFQIVGAFFSQFLLTWAYNIDANTYESLTRNPDFSRLSISLGRWSNFLQFIIYMGIPALLMTKVNGKKIWDITGRTASNWRGKNFSLSIIVGVTSIPVVAVMTQIMRSTQPQGQIGNILQELDATRTLLFENMLQMDSTIELSWVFVLLAVLPAFFEEYLFRGIILGIGKKEFQKRWVAVVFQALVFALLHFSYFELPGIFLMGFVFGLITLRNGHIWFGVVAHMVFNGTTVAVQYFMKNSSQPEYDKVDQLIANFTIATPAAILLGVALYQLTRKPKNHETQ